MKVEPATADDVRHVAMSMRDSDLREFLSTSPATTRAELADIMAERYGGRDDVICAGDDLEPIAIGSLVEGSPNVGTLLFFATEKLPEIGRDLTRFIRQELFPRYRAAGMHRIQCVSHVDHDAAHRWIAVLGLKLEYPIRRLGKHGETFLQFAWVADDVCAPRN